MAVSGEAAVDGNAEAHIHQQLCRNLPSTQAGQIKLQGGHQHRVGKGLLEHMEGKHQCRNI